MIDDKDVKKIIEAMGEVFPTAKMMNDSFDAMEKRMATKEQVQKIDERLAGVEETLKKLDEIPTRMKIVEEALGIE